MTKCNMNTPVITMDAEEAKTHYDEYKTLVAGRKEKYLEDLKKTYFHLSKERKILDIFEVFKACGVDERGEPKLAIAPAHAKTIILEKGAVGSATFTAHDRWSKAYKSDVQLPSGTFPVFKEEKDGRIPWNGERTSVESLVPIVPAHLLPEGDLKNYYILFEVKEWFEPRKASYAKGDPYLLKRINNNTFAVLAEWDVTDLEVAVLRGL